MEGISKNVLQWRGLHTFLPIVMKNKCFITIFINEEPTADDVVAGIIFINDVRYRALFDTCASHLFIYIYYLP